MNTFITLLLKHNEAYASCYDSRSHVLWYENYNNNKKKHTQRKVGKCTFFKTGIWFIWGALGQGSMDCCNGIGSSVRIKDYPSLPLSVSEEWWLCDQDGCAKNSGAQPQTEVKSVWLQTHSLLFHFHLFGVLFSLPHVLQYQTNPVYSRLCSIEWECSFLMLGNVCGIIIF